MSETSPSTWRSELPVLVPEAHAVGAIGVIRSLGRSGYPVHAVAQDPRALGLRSRFAAGAAVAPSYGSADFIPWLRQFVAQHRIRAIVPSEAFVLAIRPVIDEFLDLMPVTCEARSIYAAMSKFDLFRALLSGSEEPLAQHLPPTRLFEQGRCVGENAGEEDLGWPVFLKGDGCYGTSGMEGRVATAGSSEELSGLLRTFRKDFDRFLVQGFVPGGDAGVYFLLWDERVLAQFMNRSLHSVPHTGGFYSLRESCRDEEVLRDALGKLKKMRWRGVAMMEYRWDAPTGRFWLVEMNARFWGSLHHALYAGVDFPRLLLDSFFGRFPEPVLKFPEGLRCRYTFPAEVAYVASRWKDPDVPLPAKLWSIAEFFLMFADVRCRSDLYFPGDEGLYWESVRRTLAERRRP